MKSGHQMTVVLAPIGLERHRVRSPAALSAAVQLGLPKLALKTGLAEVFPEGGQRTAMLDRVLPEASFKRRRGHRKREESQKPYGSSRSFVS